MFNRIKSTPPNRTDMLTNVYCLFHDVNEEKAEEITEWILFNNYLPPEERPDALTLIVNSNGGSLPAAFSIVDFMRSSEIPVHTIGSGIIASAGLFIVMSGVKGERTLSEYCSIMSHQFATETGYDKYHELMSVVDEFENTQNRLISHLKLCTGLTRKQIDKKLMNKSDIWLTAQEAVDLGLADNIQLVK